MPHVKIKKNWLGKVVGAVIDGIEVDVTGNDPYIKDLPTARMAVRRASELLEVQRGGHRIGGKGAAKSVRIINSGD